MSAGGYTRDFGAIAAAERAWLARRRQAEGLPAPGRDTVGLAFSGGGIRSAVFNLGVLEALESAGIHRHVDYLSSVSGGGYIACAYGWLRAQLSAGSTDTFDAELAGGNGNARDWIRRHARYLVDSKRFSIATLLSSIGAAVLLNLLVLAAPLVLATDLMTLHFLPIHWPQWSAAWDMPVAHDGFLLLLAASGLCFLAWPLLALYFAVVATRSGISAPARVDRVRVAMGLAPSVGLALAALGSIPIAAHWCDLSLARWIPHLAGGGASMTSLGALVSGALGFWRAQARSGVNAQRVAMLALALLVYGVFVLAYAVAARVDTLHSPLFLSLLALSLALGSFASLNAVSIHGYYRDRLRQMMMPVLARRPKACPDSFRTEDIVPDHGAPFHLVCATLNTSTSPDERRRSREGECYTFTPLYFGSTATGWASAADNPREDSRLAAAIAIAGAAVDPDSPQTRNRALSFLMALFNLRLGYWGHNPDPQARRSLPFPPWWVKIYRELAGQRLDERWRDIHLSDGGQFENLGLYELIRRRVPYLIAVDAGADPDTHYTDLGNLIERVRVDFGAEVDLRLGLDSELRPWRLGEVRYADGSRGRLLYFKTCVHGEVSGDVLAYRLQHPSFPNESTADQFFTEAQFEAYRWLARETVRASLAGGRYDSVATWFEALAVAQDRHAADDAAAAAGERARAS